MFRSDIRVLGQWQHYQGSGAAGSAGRVTDGAPFLDERRVELPGSRRLGWLPSSSGAVGAQGSASRGNHQQTCLNDVAVNLLSATYLATSESEAILATTRPCRSSRPRSSPSSTPSVPLSELASLPRKLLLAHRFRIDFSSTPRRSLVNSSSTPR